MPVVSAHCFANHRGGVGKTTLAFQVSAAYAVAHPEQNVLVIDATEIGDVSEMLVGGLFEKRGRDALRSLVPLSNTTQLFLRALAASYSTHLKELMEGEESPIVSKVLDEMPQAKEEGGKLGGDTEKSLELDLAEFAIPLKHVNLRVPDNMYLCPSALDIDQSIPFSESQRLNIISVLRQSFKLARGEWKVFFDTDAGAVGEIYCNIAVGASDFCLLPLHADMSDWYRVRSLLDEIKMVRQAGVSDGKVQMVLWNGLSVKYNYRCFSSAKCMFAPTKAEQDVIVSLNNLVYEEAERNPDLFVYAGGDANEFHMRSSICVRNFSVVGVASKDSGIPIVCISPGIFHGVHMQYALREATIEHCRENLNKVVKAIDEATYGPSKKEQASTKKRAGSKLQAAARRLKLRSGAATSKASSSAVSDIARKYRVYNTRNKYSLRGRNRKSALSNGFVDFSSTSTTLS